MKVYESPYRGLTVYALCESCVRECRSTHGAGTWPEVGETGQECENCARIENWKPEEGETIRLVQEQRVAFDEKYKEYDIE